MEASVKLTRALEIAGKARIRRCIAAPSDAARERVAPSSERPSALRDSHGRFLKGWVGGPGRPPRDALRELYIDDLFAIWKKHGRQVIKQLAEEHPAVYFRIVADVVRKVHRPSDD